MSIVSGSSSSCSSSTTSWSQGQRPTMRSSSPIHQRPISPCTILVRRRSRSVTPSSAELMSRSGGCGGSGKMRAWTRAEPAARVVRAAAAISATAFVPTARNANADTVRRMLAQDNSGAARLRELLAGPEPVVAPGAYDALSARLVEQAGFDAVYMTGFGTSASLLGQPDVGLLTGAEMVDNARRIVSAVDVPVVADADTGYGNALNVVRTVQLYEQAGVAGIQLEDQVAPKKCGHMSGKAVLRTAEM